MATRAQGGGTGPSTHGPTHGSPRAASAMSMTAIVLSPAPSPRPFPGHLAPPANKSSVWPLGSAASCWPRSGLHTQSLGGILLPVCPAPILGGWPFMTKPSQVMLRLPPGPGTSHCLNRRVLVDDNLSQLQEVCLAVFWARPGAPRLRASEFCGHSFPEDLVPGRGAAWRQELTVGGRGAPSLLATRAPSPWRGLQEPLLRGQVWTGLSPSDRGGCGQGQDISPSLEGRTQDMRLGVCVEGSVGNLPGWRWSPA